MAASIEMLEPCIQRDHEQTSALPLEALLGAAPFENVHEFLVEMALRRRFPASRDFTDVGIVRIAGSFQIDNGPSAAFALPGPESHFIEIWNEKRFDDWYALFCRPSLIAGFSVRQRAKFIHVRSVGVHF